MSKTFVSFINTDGYTILVNKDKIEFCEEHKKERTWTVLHYREETYVVVSCPIDDVLNKLNGDTNETN